MKRPVVHMKIVICEHLSWGLYGGRESHGLVMQLARAGATPEAVLIEVEERRHNGSIQLYREIREALEKRATEG